MQKKTDKWSIDFTSKKSKRKHPVSFLQIAKNHIVKPQKDIPKKLSTSIDKIVSGK